MESTNWKRKWTKIKWSVTPKKQWRSFQWYHRHRLLRKRENKWTLYKQSRLQNLQKFYPSKDSTKKSSMFTCFVSTSQQQPQQITTNPNWDTTLVATPTSRRLPNKVEIVQSCSLLSLRKKKSISFFLWRKSRRLWKTTRKTATTNKKKCR